MYRPLSNRERLELVVRQALDHDMHYDECDWRRIALAAHAPWMRVTLDELEIAVRKSAMRGDDETEMIDAIEKAGNR